MIKPRFIYEGLIKSSAKSRTYKYTDAEYFAVDLFQPSGLCQYE